MIKYLTILLLLLSISTNGQNFTYSGFIRNANGTGAVNVPIKLYKRTTPTLTGFTSQTNYNNHSVFLKFVRVNENNETSILINNNLINYNYE
jgi:hypothetical protein